MFNSGFFTAYTWQARHWQHPSDLEDTVIRYVAVILFMPQGAAGVEFPQGAAGLEFPQGAAEVED